MAGGKEEGVGEILKTNSFFTVKDKDTGKDAEKFVMDIKHLTTPKWIASTYGRMKKAYQEAYPDEALPFEEGK